MYSWWRPRCMQGLAPAEHRVRMCELATDSSSFIMVDSWEVSLCPLSTPTPRASGHLFLSTRFLLISMHNQHVISGSPRLAPMQFHAVSTRPSSPATSGR